MVWQHHKEVSRENAQFKRDWGHDALESFEEGAVSRTSSHEIVIPSGIRRDDTAGIVTNNVNLNLFDGGIYEWHKIRLLSGLEGDGAFLVDKAFGFKEGANPVLAINELTSETQRGEQRGFVNLLKGLLGTIRNPLAHDPKIERDMSAQDALDILTTLSLIHRKLDKTHRYGV